MTALACPNCKQQLQNNATGAQQCATCSVSYPKLDRLAWLWPDPAAALMDWRNRYNRLLAELEADIERADDSNDALMAYQAQLSELLAELKVSEPRAKELHYALRTQLPDHHAVDSYNSNIFRDWCWGEDENRATLDHLAEFLTDEYQDKNLLVLGSGAGRLPYDLHTAHSFKTTYALDSNPLLCLIADVMFNGEQLQFTEFPRAPLNRTAIERTLQSPGAQASLQAVCGDALHPPFTPGSIDVLVTSWLIDVVDAPLEAQIRGYASLLKPGGVWLNHGSLVFESRNIDARILATDVRVSTEGHGFEVVAFADTELPYLHSPDDRHKRIELTYTQLARRTEAEVEIPTTPPPLPDWLRETGRAVPRSETFVSQITSTRVHAFILGLIDGQRSIKEIAEVMEEQQLMPAREAVAAVQQLLRVMHNEALSQGRQRNY